MTDAVVKYETEHGEVKLSPGLIKRYLVSGNPNAVTDQELTMFLQLCRYQRLNPWLREAYLIKYGSESATMITGKDVFTKRAAKNADFNGIEAGIAVLTEKGDVVWRDGTLKLPSDTLIGGWARVHRKGWDHPVTASVALEEYIGRKKDGTVTRQWQKMPATMIAKVAKVQALREAFPEDFQGLYDEAEIPTGDQPLPSAPVSPQEDAKPEPKPVEPEAEKPEVEDAEVVEEEGGDDPLETLRGQAREVFTRAEIAKIFTETQLKSYRAQIENLRSETALNAIIANFERQLKAASEEKTKEEELF